ncbi:MAG: hypothetical protein K0R34_731 [Herbinix sp.]|jgi:membrane protease YdiL (CAAX protease family)|nr:hypothetical protein [Herbinix sp.]
MNVYNLSKTKTLMHIVALFVIMFIGDFFSSLPFDIIFRFIELPFDWAYSGVRITASIIVTYLIFRFYTDKFLHSKMEDFRIGRPHLKIIDVLYALLLPAFVIGGFIIFGRPFINNAMTNDVMNSTVIIALFRALKAGILEEMLFRGYIMKLLENRWNKYIAIILPSFVFSLVHIPSMEVFNLVSLLLLICSGTLVGIMFSLVTYRNNSIWGSSLIHTIWNFIICGNILHIFFGKNISPKAIFSIILPTENPLLTGAGFGIEASIIAIVGYTILAVTALLSIKNQNKKVRGLFS